MEDRIELIYQDLQLRLRYPIKGPDFKSSRQDEESQEVKLIQLLKSGREYLIDLDQRCVDFLALNTYDGDPLSSKTIALISYAIAEHIKESAPELNPELMAKLSFLYDVGKKHIYKTISEDYGFKEKVYDPGERYSPDQRAKMLHDIKQKTLVFLEKTGMQDIIFFVEDFYGARETIESQILKAAQIYVGIKVPKAHKNIDKGDINEHQAEEKIKAALEKNHIPERVINVMYKLNLL